MDLWIVTIIGLLAAAFQTARLFPQIVKGYKTKSVKDLSWGWIIVGSIGAILWTLYGIFQSDYIIVGANLVNLICYFLIMHQKYILYPVKS